MLHTTWHAISVFFDHLAAVQWQWLGLAVVCQLCKLVAVSPGRFLHAYERQDDAGRDIAGRFIDVTSRRRAS